MTYSEPMAAVVRQVGPLMKSHGFRKRRHSFNRGVQDGVVQHLSFQLGAFHPPGTVEIPGLRPNLYGRFTVNLGAYVPAMNRNIAYAPKSDWVNDYNCQLRIRIGELLPERDDVWWYLDRESAADDVEREIAAVGLGWLDRLGGCRQIVEVFEAGGAEAVGLPAAGAMDIASIYLALGERTKAHDLLEWYAGTDVRPGHADVIVEFLRASGFADLIPLVSSQS